MSVKLEGRLSAEDRASAIRHSPETGHSGPARFAAIAGAGVCLLLATVGAVIPGIPTTPFVLLASWLLLKGSPTLHARLRRSKWFGELLDNWEVRRAISLRVRRRSLAIVGLCLLITLFQPELSVGLRAVILGCSVIGITVICRIPVVENQSLDPERTRTKNQRVPSGDSVE